MIEPLHPKISVSRQCQLLALPRSTRYHRPKPVANETLNLMKRIDELYLMHPFYGARQMMRALSRLGYEVGRKRVSRLMTLMGLEAIYRKPNLSKANPAHSIYPYLLRGLKVDRPNQVWATDITYIPVDGGYAYLCAIIDWHSRCVLGWELSNTMDTGLCVRVLRRALASHGTPEIFNTDQGSQFTSLEFTGVLKAHGVKISMDGKGRCLDNVFVERLWRSVKYEEVYLHAYANLIEAEYQLRAYFRFYNERRPHSAHGRQTPSEVYLQQTKPQQAA